MYSTNANIRALNKLKENKAVFLQITLGFDEPTYKLELYYEKLIDEIGNHEDIKSKLHGNVVLNGKNELPKGLKEHISTEFEDKSWSLEIFTSGLLEADDKTIREKMDEYDIAYLFYIFSDYIQLKKDGRHVVSGKAVMDNTKWGESLNIKEYSI